MAKNFKQSCRKGLQWGAVVALALAGQLALAHGDVTPQAVDTKGLPQLGYSISCWSIFHLIVVVF